MSEKNSAFFLAAESPYPVVGGGALRSASILEYLLTHYETDVFCFAQPEERFDGRTAREEVGADPRRRARSWVTARLPEHRNNVMARGLRNSSRLVRGVPPLVDRFRGFEGEVAAAAGAGGYSIAIVEHFWCAPYAAALRPHCERLVLDLHNVESLWHQRSARVLGFPLSMPHERFAASAARMECELLPEFDQILVTSQSECNYLKTRTGHTQIAVVPNTIPYRVPFLGPRGATIVFSGNMEYPPNRQGVCHFAEKIWPIVTRLHPECRWKIVGKSANRLGKLAETDPRVILVPNPTDAMMEIATAQVAVVPLLLGTGTRLKIIEAWAAGTPVVSTSIGAEGLEYRAGEDILVEDDPLRFAAAIDGLMKNAELACALSRSARRRFETTYTWQRAWEALAACAI